MKTNQKMSLIKREKAAGVFNISAHKKPSGKTTNPFTELFSWFETSGRSGVVTSSGKPVYDTTFSILVEMEM